ncbi:MAG: hypothetical protein JNJ60_02635, partial [Rhodocyclaceae bacterium]|nr:hypothetical protein [Rhodocyclaceae bacterium]
KVVAVHCEYFPDSRSGTPGADNYKVKGNLHWVSREHACAAPVRLYDRLFGHPFPGSAKGRGWVASEDDSGKLHVEDGNPEHNFLDDLNPASRREITAMLEPALREARPEDRFQFERHGYFVADRVDSREQAPVFNLTVTLKDSWARHGGR